MNRLTFFIASLIYLSIILLINNLRLIFEISFYFYLILLAIDIFTKKSFYLLHLWLVSFIYIILSEGVLYYKDLQLDGSNALFASKIILSANVMLIFGYIITPQTLGKKRTYNNIIQIKKHVFFLIPLLVILYTSFGLSKFNGNPDLGAFDFIKLFINALGLILPAFIAFIFKKISNNKIISILLALPIFFILFLTGTRYPLLFSIVGFLVIYLDFSVINIKRFLLFFLPSLLFLLIITDAMKQFRGSRTSSKSEAVQSTIQNYLYSNKNTSIAQSLASRMSPEGVIKSYSKMVIFFKDRPFLYGESTGFVFYFWIPRSVWKDKPTMLGHWLIRDFGDKGFGEGHSASFGFAGDFYADFGISGSIFLSFLLGIGLKKLENLRLQSLSENDEKIILYAMFYPYVFFAVRSPVTATITFISIYVIYVILRKSIIKRITIPFSNPKK